MGKQYAIPVTLSLLFGIVFTIPSWRSDLYSLRNTTSRPWESRPWESQSYDASQQLMTCHLSSTQNVDTCETEIFCPRGTRGLQNSIKNVHCHISEEHVDYEYADYEDEKEIKHYILLTINDTKYYDPFYEITRYNLQNRIKTLKLLNGDFVNVPNFVYSCTELTELTLSNTGLLITNINNLTYLENLKTINMSHNYIVTTGLENTDTKQAKSLVTTIDLSYNLIKYLRKGSFSVFTELRNLYLSNNLISSIDVLLFDGLSQLQILHLSNNKLTEIGQTLARTPNLKEVTLDNNLLTSISNIDFNELTKLEKLNVSHNNIRNIEDKAFQNLTMLSELDLSFNRIAIVPKTLFKNNKDLHSLSLRNNIIEIVESGTFEGKNISDFFIDNNCLAGVISKDTFRGTHMNSLDLSQGKITTIGPEAFSLLHLRYLNLSSNLISSVSKSSFHSLKLLEILDISNNNINEFEISDSNDLLIVIARNNSIRKISRDMLKNLTSLEELDLSQNSISEIETDSFSDLFSLQRLVLSNNIISKESVPSGTFNKLVSLEYLDLSYCNITLLHDGIVSGLRSLVYFNSSHCQIKLVDFNSFVNAENIEILDLSYNALDKFSVNTTSISQIKAIYLGSNKITKINKETFSGLVNLNKLDLSNNNILQINSMAFRHLDNLEYLDLQSNNEAEIDAGTFDNLMLEVLLLSNIKKKFDFEYVTNTSVEYLDLSSCDITNVDLINVFKIKNILSLLLHSNMITSIDKKSFQNMSSLDLLDLSYNSISYIQPGTFIRTENLTTLNLHDNNITKLEYGVFEGLKNLKLLNLSSNFILNFDVTNIRNLPSLITIALDDNLFERFTFGGFASKGIKKITIGGNPIPCNTLHGYLNEGSIGYFGSYRQQSKMNITAETLDYHSQNVDGIKCKAEVSSRGESPYENSIVNLTVAIKALGDAVMKLNEKNFTYDNDSKNIESLTNDTNINEKIKRILLTEKVIEEVKNALQDHDSEHFNSNNDGNSNVNNVLVAIVILLVIMLLMCTSVFVYKFRRSGNFLRLNDSQSRSTQLLTNSIELN